MSAFKDRVAKYNSQKETKVNPPEATKVLETKSEPEVANVKAEAPPVESAAAPEPSPPSEATNVAPTEAEAPKARRGRPAGSKNSPKPPAAEPASEGTSAPVPRVVVTGEMCTDVNELVAALNAYGYTVTLTR